MRATFILVAASFGVLTFAMAEEGTLDEFGTFLADSDTNTPVNYVMAPAPTFRILPQDVVQTSIRVLRHASGDYTVFWAYTEVGEQKRRTFLEAHEGRKIRIAAGKFETPPTQIVSRPGPSMSTNNNQLEKRGLRTDKFFRVSEKDAMAIAKGLGSKTWDPKQSPTDRGFAIPRLNDPGDANLMRNYHQRVENYLQAPNNRVMPSLYPSLVERLGGQ